MELFYVLPENIDGNYLTLDDFESQHLRTTLRKKEGDEINLTDGCGNHLTGTIRRLKPQVTVNINSKTFYKDNDPVINLGIGFIKPGRLEFVLEKGTELGVKKFHIFRSEYSSYYTDNVKRFEKVTRQAIKQSNRFYMPEIYISASLNEPISSKG